MSDIFKDLLEVTRRVYSAPKPNALYVILDRGRSGGVWRAENLTTPLFDSEKVERHSQYETLRALEGR